MSVRDQVRELFTRPPRRLGSEDPTARFNREDDPEEPPAQGGGAGTDSSAATTRKS